MSDTQWDNIIKWKGKLKYLHASKTEVRNVVHDIIRSTIIIIRSCMRFKLKMHSSHHLRTLIGMLVSRTTSVRITKRCYKNKPYGYFLISHQIWSTKKKKTVSRQVNKVRERLQSRETNAECKETENQQSDTLHHTPASSIGANV